MKGIILKLFALIITLLSFCWMINFDDWEPKITFLVSFVALIKIDITDNKKSTSKKYDKALYEEFIQNIPSNGSIEYLREKDMRGTIDTTRLKDLEQFRNNWENAEHEFINKKIEKKKIKLLNSCNEFFGYFSLNTWNTSGSFQRVPPEWQTEQPKRYYELTTNLNNYADAIVKNHQELIQLCKKKLLT